MNKLVKFNERKVVDGFTFHKDWWGEFSPTGELVTVYAYPIVSVNTRNWTCSWTDCKIFYPFDYGFVGDILFIDDVPSEVAWHFWELAKQEMLDKWEEMAKWVEL